MRYIADQNKVVLLQESGTYAIPTASARWIGEVQELSVDEAENKLEDRYLGNASRNFANFQDGPIDVTGTLSYRPQDMMLVAHAIGSVYESSGTTFTYTATEVDTDSIQNPFTSGTSNPTSVPFSFTLEDSKQSPGTGANFIRTVKGAVINSLTLSASQGEKVSIDVDWIGENIAFSSGATTSVTASAAKPYLWNSATLTMFGSPIDQATDFSLEINNNVEAPHYLNGSRYIAAPFPGNREYTISVTSDMEAGLAKSIYEEYYRGGSTFNAVIDLNQSSTGSQHAIITMSGCVVTSMDMPSPLEGVDQQNFEVRPESVSLVEYVNPENIGSFNPY